MRIRKLSLLSLLLFLAVALSLPTLSMADAQPALPAVWTVQQAVRFALANSPDSRITRQRIDAARAMVRQSKAAFYPRLGISSQYSQTNNPMYSFGNILNLGAFNQSIDFNNPGRTDDLNLAAHLEYRLFNGGRDLAGLGAAKASVTASSSDAQALLGQLGFEVVQSFFVIVQAGETVQARQSQVEAISGSLAVARARFEAGALLRTDLLNLEVQEADARENLIAAQHGLELAKRGFLNLLGLEGGQVVLDPQPDMVLPVPLDTSCDRRPELQSLDAVIQAAEARVRQAEADRYPTADAFASYQVDKGYDPLEGSGNSWLAGVKVNYTLFEGNRSGAVIAEAKIRLIEAREQRRKLTLAIGLEAEQARLALRQAEERLQVTGKMVELARENARLNRERFKEGVVLSADLVDVENRLTDARVRQVAAKVGHRIAVADLRRAVGLAQFEESAEQGALAPASVANNQNKGGGE
ncbi:MAG: TolC family protein [Desulfobulbaceae bacterium]|nr:TolC family protein [Desulfobulbaceae bacterium]HIJ78822.1 TolC family protein [Deltaproteobacteria bacterium]